MDITFVCQSCEDSFDVTYGKLVDDSKGVRCPNCGKKLSTAEVEELVSGLDELLGQVAALRKRFLLTFEIDAEDLPPPYDTDRRRGRDDDEDEEDEDDEDDDELDADDEAEDEDDERF